MSFTRRLRIEFSGERSDLEVVLPDDATVATLIDLLGATTDDLMVDGRIVPSWQHLADAGVWDGAVIDLDQEPAPSAGATPVVSLEKIAGFGGAASRPLPPGTHEIPADGAHGSAFALTVEGDGRVIVVPRSGPLVVDNELIATATPLDDHVLVVGGARYRVGPPPTADASVADAFESPRRLRGPVQTRRSVPAVSMPRADEPGASTAWLWPVPAVVLFAVLGVTANPLFFVGAGLALAACFALLLRARRAAVAEQATHRSQAVTAVNGFAGEVSTARRSVSSDLRREHPSAAELVRRAESGRGFRLHHADEHDFARVAVGYGERSWSVDVESDFVLDPSLHAVVAHNDVLASVPICIDLTAGPIGIVGPRARRLAVARSIAVDVCSRWTSSDVRLAVATEATDLDDWDWSKWAPHLDPARHVATSMAAADRMVSSWRTPGHDWLQVVFVDQPKWMADAGSLLQIIAGEPDRQCVVVLADTLEELPWCDTLLVLEPDDTLTVTTPDAGPIRFVSPRHVPVAAADAVARAAASAQRAPSSRRGVDEPHGVRPFQLEADARPDPAGAPLAPPPVPVEPVVETDRTADSVKPTVIRAAATGDVTDGAALTPPTVPPAPDADADEVDDEPVIDLREPKADATDSASDEPGTRWTRSRR